MHRPKGGERFNHIHFDLKLLIQVHFDYLYKTVLFKTIKDHKRVGGVFVGALFQTSPFTIPLGTAVVSPASKSITVLSGPRFLSTDSGTMASTGWGGLKWDICDT